MGEIEEIHKILKDHEKRISKLESRGPRVTGKKQKPKGRKSIADLLITLKNEGFFKEPKRLSEMIARLSEKNYTLDYGDLTDPLARLVQTGTLQRKKIEKKWAYGDG